jgi:hypothetical protein
MRESIAVCSSLDSCIRRNDELMTKAYKSPVQQAWEYANDAPGAARVLVSSYLEIRLYAVGLGRQAYERWDLTKLTDPREYAHLQWLLSAKQLLSGETAKILARSAQLEKEITLIITPFGEADICLPKRSKLVSSVTSCHDSETDLKLQRDYANPYFVRWYTD